MVWTLLCIAADINVREVTHIPGEENERCDRLSRRGLNPLISVVEEAADMGITGARVIEMNEDEAIRGIIELCDPRITLKSEGEYVEFWTRARRVIENFITTHAPRQQSSKEEVNITSPFFLSPYTLPT
jgi:hypothetical protein